MEAVVWEGSGSVWPGVSWSSPVAYQLTRLGWRTSVVPWGDPGIAHRGLPDVLHVFSGGMEPVTSGSAAMADRLDAVADALAAVRLGTCSVVGICLGAQMVATVSAGFMPQLVTGGGEAGLTRVRSCDPAVPDLVVATAHVQEVPEEFLSVPGVRQLWSSDVTAVQGFALGDRVVGVQFHPELSAREARWAARSFRAELDAPPASGWAHAVDPEAALRTVLAAAGADQPIPVAAGLDVGLGVGPAPGDGVEEVLEAV